MGQGNAFFQNTMIKAIHPTMTLRLQYCSVITQNSDTAFLGFVLNKYAVPGGHEVRIRAFNTTRSQSDTPASVALKIITADTIRDSSRDDIRGSLLVARTVTNWCAKTSLAEGQVANSTENHHWHFISSYSNA